MYKVRVPHILSICLFNCNKRVNICNFFLKVRVGVPDFACLKGVLVWKTLYDFYISRSECEENKTEDTLWPLLKSVAAILISTRLCPKENFREPFGLPSVLAWVPRPKSWSPKLKFRSGALRAPKHFSWGAQAS